MKVSIIGMGRVGGSLGYLLAGEKNIDELVFVDEISKLSEGITLDITNAYPESSFKIKSGNLSAADDSDILIIAASAPTDPKIRIRMDLLPANKPVIEKIFTTVRLKKNTTVIMVTNPVEPLGALALSLSKLPSQRVIGFGNALDTARLKAIISRKTKIHANRINITVLGEHGENMIPIFSSAKIDGKPIELYKLDTKKLTDSLKEEGYKIRQLTGGVRFGASHHIFELIQSILRDKNKMFPVSSFIESNNYYGIENVFISLPTKISSKGVSEIVEIPINSEERDKIISLAKSLKEIQSNQ